MTVRTTITLSDRTHLELKRRAAAEGISFKDAVNNALDAGLSGAVPPRPYRLKPVSLGAPLAPIDHTLRLAGEMEDAEIIRKMDLGK